MIILSSILLILALGFMTDFFTLFMDGNDEMYDLFKNLQILNNVLFNSSLIYLVLSLFLFPFDINKKTAGLFGVGFTLIIALLNIVNGITLFSTNSYFINAMSQIDFSGFEGTVPSTVPFSLISILFGLAIALSVLLAAVTGFNFLRSRKEGALK
ncbi:MAG: hypothetical protein PQJ58_04715 [Spirochaetales bacterium]|nr:hypothetical protein [Spirochaetales bacterium]